MVRFLINTTEDLKTQLTKIAKCRGQTLNGLIRQILWDYINKTKAS